MGKTKKSKVAKKNTGVKKAIKKEPKPEKKPVIEKSKKQQKAKEKKEKKAKEEKEPKKAVYTPDQKEKYQKILKDYEDKPLPFLQNMLMKNDQTKTGTKKELLIKVADGIVLGKMPRCPHCFGGRLRFDNKKGVYNCPGYRDDDHFHNCHKKFTLEEIKRDPWVE